MSEIDFVLAHYGEHGWGVTSPQIPGLIAGKPHLEDLTPEYLLSLAHDAGADASEGFRVHVDAVEIVDGAVCHVIARQLPIIPELLGPLQAFMRQQVVNTPNLVERAPADALGERYFFAALASDTVASLARLVPDAAGFVAAVAVDDQVLWVRLVPTESVDGEVQARRDQTLGDIIARHGGEVRQHRDLVFA